MSMKNEKYSSKKAMMRHEKTEGAKEREMEYGIKKKKLGVKKPAAKKGDGMMTTKEVTKIYNKARNKKGKYDPTKIPGFKFGKGTE